MVMATTSHPAATQPAPAQQTSAAPSSNQGTPQQDSSSAAPVSPDNVGRLFVQQYYTVLNKAPHLLHRFYTKGSSFVHGKVDRDGNAEEPVYGQNEIYLKIMTLDFRDCYAKIRQVDSYATLGDGVVVQVTGELSTHGKPMRRFTQTFVLAPHSARNYYVRNDIFRYHDEVFQETENEEDRVESDEETIESPADKQDSDDVEGESDELEDHSQPSTITANLLPGSHATDPTHSQMAPAQSLVTPAQPHTAPAHSHAAPTQPHTAPHHTHVAPAQPLTAPVQPHTAHTAPVPSQLTTIPPQTSLPSRASPVPTQEPTTYYSPPPSAVSNGTSHLESSPGGTPPKVQHQVDDSVEEKLDPDDLQDTATPPVVPSPPPQENHEDDDIKAEVMKEPPPVIQENKVFSWADRVQGGPKPTVTQAPLPAAPVTSQPKPPADSFGGPPVGQRGVGPEALPQREPRKGRGGGNWPRRGPDVGESDRAPRGPPGRIFSDKQQLFVGNLPQDIKDEELKEFFSKYGKVVEMRINRNSNPKLPFFGFIVFEEAGPVQDILELRRKQPILFRDGYRLNVEEKKPKGTEPRQRIRDNRPSGGPPPRGGSLGRGGGRGGPGMGPPRMGRGFGGPQR